MAKSVGKKLLKALERFIESGVDESLPTLLAARVRFLNVLGLIVVGLTLPFLLIYLVTEQYLMAASVLPWLAIFSLAIWLNGKKIHTIARVLFLTATNIAIVGSTWILGPIPNIDLFCFAASIIPFLLFVGKEIVPLTTFCLIPIICFITTRFLAPEFFKGAVDLPIALEIFLRNIMVPSAFITTIAPVALLFYLERRQFAAQIAEREERYRSEKLASLGLMSAGISHEINNPTAIIDGQAGRVQKFLAKDELSLEVIEQIRKAMETIRQQTKRIAKIVRGMLTFARDGHLDQMETKDVRGIVEDTVALCRVNFLSSNIELKIDLGSEVIPVMCRPTEIMQVILNLLNNAHDALQGKNQAWVSIMLKIIDQKIFLSVVDSGSIPEEIRNKIGKALFTTKASGKGTGLGLSLSMQLIQQHGGQLYLDTKQSTTCFVVQLPLCTNISKESPESIQEAG